MIAEGGRVDANGVLTTGLRAGHAPRWASSLQCAADCVRSEGVVGGLLLRGVSATVSRAGLLTAAQILVLNKLFREKWAAYGWKLCTPRAGAQQHGSCCTKTESSAMAHQRQ